MSFEPGEADEARRLGFLRSEKYGHVERERRWLCDGLPDVGVTRSCEITDLYIADTRMRLREMRFADGSVERKLTKKAELSPDRRVITTIYLSDAEYALLAGLSGSKLSKTRHYLDTSPEVCVDVFTDGLHIAEVEFANSIAAQSYAALPWMGREVTNNPDCSGHRLAEKLGEIF